MLMMLYRMHFSTSPHRTSLNDVRPSLRHVYTELNVRRGKRQCSKSPEWATDCCHVVQRAPSYHCQPLWCCVKSCLTDQSWSIKCTARNLACYWTMGKSDCASKKLLQIIWTGIKHFWDTAQQLLLLSFLLSYPYWPKQRNRPQCFASSLT